MVLPPVLPASFLSGLLLPELEPVFEPVLESPVFPVPELPVLPLLLVPVLLLPLLPGVVSLSPASEVLPVAPAPVPPPSVVSWGLLLWLPGPPLLLPGPAGASGCSCSTLVSVSPAGPVWVSPGSPARSLLLPLVAVPVPVPVPLLLPVPSLLLLLARLPVRLPVPLPARSLPAASVLVLVSPVFWALVPVSPVRGVRREMPASTSLSSVSLMSLVPPPVMTVPPLVPVLVSMVPSTSVPVSVIQRRSRCIRAARRRSDGPPAPVVPVPRAVRRAPCRRRCVRRWRQR